MSRNAVPSETRAGFRKSKSKSKTYLLATLPSWIHNNYTVNKMKHSKPGSFRRWQYSPSAWDVCPPPTGLDETMNEYNNTFKAMTLTSLAVGLQSNYIEHVNATAVDETMNEYNNSFKAMTLTSLAVGLPSNCVEHLNATAVGATMNEYNNTFKAMTLTSLAVGLHTIQLHGTCERNSSGRNNE